MKNRIQLGVFLCLMCAPMYARLSWQQRKALRVIKNLQNYIDIYKNEIKNIERRAGVSRIRDNIESRKKRIDLIKKKYNITQLEQQKNALTKQIDEIAAKMYAESISQDGKSLFKDVNKVIKDEVFGSVRIQIKLNEILSALQEIQKLAQRPKTKIVQLGKKIDTQTFEKQLEMKNIKNKILQIQQQINTKLLQPEVNKQLEALEQNILDLEQSLEERLGRLSRGDQRTIQKLKNKIEQNTIILDFIRNPEKIESISIEELIGL